MKKLLIISNFFIFFLGIAQCPAPSNLTAINNIFDVQLNWTENGIATVWEIAVVSDFYIGATTPDNGWISTSNPFIYVGIPQGCNVFYIRSVCSSNNVSPWSIVGSSCSPDVYAYIETLSNNSNTLNPDKKELKIYPNPAKNSLTISVIQEIKISSISIYNTQGQLLQTRTNPEKNIDVSELKGGNYYIKIISNKEVTITKFVKE